eukprot:m.308512 g.308512  ORF g.308512 m.308512 type:complete len:99 (+) comp23027_c6_seq8:387-683(+)
MMMVVMMKMTVAMGAAWLRCTPCRARSCWRSLSSIVHGFSLLRRLGGPQRLRERLAVLLATAAPAQAAGDPVSAEAEAAQPRLQQRGDVVAWLKLLES